MGIIAIMFIAIGGTIIMFASNELMRWYIDNTQLREEQDRCQVCGTDDQMILMYDADIDYSSLCSKHIKFINKIHDLERELLDARPVTKSYGYKDSWQQSIDELQRKGDYVSAGNIKLSYKNFLALHEAERKGLMQVMSATYEPIYVGPNPPPVTEHSKPLWMNVGGVVDSADPQLIEHIWR